MFHLLTEYPTWYLMPFALLAGAYAWLLYQKKSPWAKSWDYALGTARFIVVFLLLFFLLGPFVKQIKNYFEKPVIVLAIDDSESIPLVLKEGQINKLKESLAQTAEALSQKGFEVAIKTLGGDLGGLDSLKFAGKQTNLDKLLSGAETAYEGKNLASVILISDGIFNQGAPLGQRNYKTPVYTIGVGDTVPQNDLSIKAVYHNKVAYLGNMFPVAAEIQNSGFVGSKAKAVLTDGNKVLGEQELFFEQDGQISKLNFLIKAEAKGMQHYVLKLGPLDKEFTQDNNIRHIYVDVIDGKEKILILAAAPHPDIKALKAAIAKNENYEADLFIPALGHQWNKSVKYDLVIFHQTPEIGGGPLADAYKFYLPTTPAIFVLGKKTDFAAFNQANGVLSISPKGGQFDLVTPVFNNAFNTFIFEDDKKGKLQKYPPINVPFGTYKLSAGSAVMLFQKVGKVDTGQPLVAVSGKQSSPKRAVFCGEGLWQWRTGEYADFASHEAFDELILKLVQYLSAKDDKRKFRVTPGADSFYDSDDVYFDTEVYNDIYENIFGQKVELKITDEQGGTQKFSYVNSYSGFKFKLGGLKEGVYKYSASATVDGQQLTSDGRFTVKSLRLEALDTRADFNALRLLSQSSGGAFYVLDKAADLANEFSPEKYPSRMHSTESFDELVNVKWLLFLLLALASAEWFVRKFKGGY